MAIVRLTTALPSCPRQGSMANLTYSDIVDRLQRLRVTGAANDDLRQAIEQAVRSLPGVREATWNATSEKLVARTHWTIVNAPHEITVNVEGSSPSHLDIFVCSQTVPVLPLDYGRNKWNLELFLDALAAKGITVEAGPMTTSWRRSTRP